MNADSFRYLYNYHFAENRKLWDMCLDLSYKAFVQPDSYSQGSVRDQIVHLIEADHVWFSSLIGGDFPAPFPPGSSDDREAIRAYWDQVERKVRIYLADLQDDMLFKRPIEEPEEDRVLILWQVLLHVANHGTDHRAQLLRQLHDLGIETKWQDFIFYAYEHPE